MQTLEDTKLLESAPPGFAVASGPIRRKPRKPSDKPAPRPTYADAVEYSFKHDQPLEVTVPTRTVADTVRALKAAARYLDRNMPGVEVRVQIAVEAVEADGKPVKPARSVVKFLGHEPWMLGRRIAKVGSEAQPGPDELPARTSARHRRTTAGTRSGSRLRAVLPGALVRAVITAQPLFPVCNQAQGLPCFSPAYTTNRTLVSTSLLPAVPGCTIPSPRGSFTWDGNGQEGGFMQYYREYLDLIDPGTGEHYTAEVRLCHDFPEIQPNDGNQLVVFDERVAASMDAPWAHAEMPTDTWGVLVC